MIELVLGTDMKNHFSIVGHFNTSHRIMQTASIEPVERAIATTESEVNSTESRLLVEAASQAHLLLSLQMALKCSDLSHTFADLPVHLKWVDKLEEEVGLGRQGPRH